MTEEKPARMDEIETLTKRFKDYIDKIQAAYGKTEEHKPEQPMGNSTGDLSSKKLYTVVSPVDAMTRNMKSVLSAIDSAILNMDLLGDVAIVSPGNVGEGYDEPRTLANGAVVETEPNHERFTEEELDFLVRTFNDILNSSEEERKKLFSRIEKKDRP